MFQRLKDWIKFELFWEEQRRREHIELSKEYGFFNWYEAAKATRKNNRIDAKEIREYLEKDD